MQRSSQPSGRGLSAIPGLNFKGYEFHEAAISTCHRTRSPPERSQLRATLPSIAAVAATRDGINAHARPDLMESKNTQVSIEIGHLASALQLRHHAARRLRGRRDARSCRCRHGIRQLPCVGHAKGNVLHYEDVLRRAPGGDSADRAADFRKFESAILSDEKGTPCSKA